MSQYHTKVYKQAASRVFGFDLKKSERRLIEAGKENEVVVTVMHGFDRPLHQYFCQVSPFEDPEEILEISYGNPMGVLGKDMNKDEYHQAMKDLGLNKAAEAVFFDQPY